MRRPRLFAHDAHRVGDRLSRERAVRQPAREDRRRRVPVGPRERGEREPPRPRPERRRTAGRRKLAPARGRPRQPASPRPAGSSSSFSPADRATMSHGGTPHASSAPIIEPAEVPTMRRALPGSQPVSDAIASSAPVSHAPPSTPPAPNTKPILGRPEPSMHPPTLPSLEPRQTPASGPLRRGPPRGRGSPPGRGS